MNAETLKVPLFLTRLSIVLFLAPWISMRFTSVDAAKGIFAKYYKVANLPDIAAYGMGIFWVLLILCFLLGIKKRISYGLVLLFHTIGTAMTIPYLLPGTENFKILFLAAVPVIGAMLLLYCLRREDTMLSLNID